MTDFSHIKNYILYLKKRHGLSVTLHSTHSISLLSSAELMPFNIHDNSYCTYLKTCSKAGRHCVEKQKMAQEKCSCRGYIGTCHAGVREFVYPITGANGTVGFISVSGYRSEQAEQYISAVSRKYELDIEKLRETYACLKKTMPDKQTIDVLLCPLCDMLELALLKQQNSLISELPFAEKVASYIRKYHTQPISSADICRHFCCSRSHLSLLFNRHMGKSIREYINELRMTDAEFLLLNSDLTVSEIAFSVGFSDSNYFSLLFKKHTGVSPTKYKKQYKHTRKK